MSKKNQKKQHLNQTSNKKKTPQKVGKKTVSDKSRLNDLETVCNQLVTVLSESSTIVVYLFDCFNMFALNESDTAENNPERVNKFIKGMRALQKYRRDIMIKVLQVTRFKANIKELYGLVKKEDIFNDRFTKLFTDINKFANTSMEFNDALKEFWSMYGDDLKNSEVSESVVITLMTLAGVPQSERDEYIKRKCVTKKDNEETANVLENNDEEVPTPSDGPVEPIQDEENK